jgi:hypothetical protein
MSDDRKKPGMAFWATVVVVAVLVAYPLSEGPAFWIMERLPKRQASRMRGACRYVYAPVDWAFLDCGPDWLKELGWGYLSWGRLSSRR